MITRDNFKNIIFKVNFRGIPITIIAQICQVNNNKNEYLQFEQLSIMGKNNRIIPIEKSCKTYNDLKTKLIKNDDFIISVQKIYNTNIETNTNEAFSIEEWKIKQLN